MTDSIFRLEHVGYAYGNREAVFKDISFEISAGEKVCLLGANGAGKSTLLKIMCGLIFPSRGRFMAFETEIAEEDLENDQVAREYHRRVGFIFQNPDVQLFTTRVWDEIAFGPLQLGLNKDEIKQRVDDVLDLLNIAHLQNRSPYHLSGGEKKKVALASVLVLNPPVLILDEPTNGLDPKTQRWLTGLLLEFNRSGGTLITSTHNLELAHALSDRALVLSEEHELVFNGSTAQALNDRELLAGVNLIDDYVHVHDGAEHRHRYSHG